MDEKRIEAAARAICEALGLNPDDQVSAGRGALTPAEKAARGEAWASFGCIVYVSRWENYREKAAEVLATAKAAVA